MSEKNRDRGWPEHDTSQRETLSTEIGGGDGGQVGVRTWRSQGQVVAVQMKNRMQRVIRHCVWLGMHTYS
jgi:hypothetical protein